MKSSQFLTAILIAIFFIAISPAYAQDDAIETTTVNEENDYKAEQENADDKAAVNKERTKNADAAEREYKAKAKEAKKVEKEAKRVERDAADASREAKKSVRMEKQAQKARIQADRQKQKAERAAKKSDNN